MKLKWSFILYLILFINITYAQAVHLQGRVIDDKTGLPIASANISIKEKRFFYPADNLGHFNITNNDITLSDTVAFSCTGYQTRKFIVSDVPLNTTVKLVPQLNILNEVKVGINTPLTVKVGAEQKSTNNVVLQFAGGDKAAFMQGSERVKGKIQSVGFYLSNGNGIFKGGDATAPFRIRLFGVDTSGKPSKELTTDIIIVSAKKNRAWFDFDISGYQIENPDSGFYASFTLLTIEYYKLKKGAETTDISGNKWETIDNDGVHHNLGAWNLTDEITPRLGVFTTKQRRSRSYFSCTTLQDMSWHWEPEYYNWEYMIRATIAPE